MATRDTIFGLIKANPGITRGDLAKLSELSSSSVSNSVRALMDDCKIVERSNPLSTGGRPISSLYPSNIGSVWVAEIGSSHARIGVSQNPFSLEAIDEVSISLTKDPKEVVTDLYDSLKSLALRVGLEESPSMLGVALPAPVDHHIQQVVDAARMPGWDNINISYLFGDIFRVPVVFENDTRAGAIGEYSMMGEANKINDFIYVKAGSGIGGSFFADGKVYAGSRGLAGDISHAPIDEAKDKPCSCGRTGCLETIGSVSGIIATLRGEGIELSSTLEVIELTRKGNHIVNNMVRNAGGYVGRILAPLVTFLNPEAVIVGGALSSIDSFIAGIRSDLYINCLPMATSKLIIERSQLKADAALYGLVDKCFGLIKEQINDEDNKIFAPSNS